ncbi:MAG: SprB repeat-containing protein [Bacteroidota bacterium]
MNSIHKYIILLLIFFITYPGYAQFVINEVSQGPSGSQEYVEILVIGDGTCNSCVDLRGWIFDDNNGWHDSPVGAGQGIAAGCMRFSYDLFWECIPAGTIILIYNNGDQNPDLPADDLTDANGDCAYVIPASSNLFDRNTTEPNSSGFVPYLSITFINGGGWSTTSMANTSDSYQVVDPNNLTAPYFSIGWGNNDEMQDIYFAGSAAGDVMYMTNAVDDDPFNQANWVVGSAGTDQTPGTPNNAANEAWINSMNNNCNPTPPLVLNFVSSTGVTCFGDCDGSATIIASGGTTPYTYQWDDPGSQAGTTANGLCGGTYYPYVTDIDGCTDTADAGVTVNEPAVLVANTSGGLTPCPCLCSGYAYLFPQGGTPPFTMIWSNGYTDQFQTSLCDGTYTVSLADANGCTANGSVTLP